MSGSKNFPSSADVVVIGAGSAGSAVIRRLLDAGRTVAVLEAGPVDDSEAIHDPLGSIGLWDSPFNWDFATEPQPFAHGKTVPQPRGKTLGGSSAFNGMIYVRGVKEDYDLWAQLGADGWDWASVEPYFRKLENFAGGSEGGRGVGGPINVQKNLTPSQIVQDWVAAAVEAGHPFNEDYNSGDILGASYTQHTILDHRRVTSWVGYVRPVEDHANLSVQPSATVTRLVFEGDRVVGVNYLLEGVEHTIRANDQVVLSAGVFGTPQILMLSGLGDANTLRRFGIPVKAHLPGVGQNLQDHFSSPIIWETHGPAPLPTEQGLEAQFFAKTRPGLVAPDVQPLMLSFVYGFIGGYLPEHGFSTVSQILHPLSRGFVTLRSNDPTAKPIIDPRVLSEPDDVEVLVDNMDMIRDIASREPLRKWIKAEARPGDKVVTREQMREYVRSTIVSGHHQVGTAAMGRGTMSVVDPTTLRVHGIEGLTIADASIMPSLPSGNTNGPAMMIGERAADIILEGATK